MVQIWLNFNNNQYMVRFPVPPEEIEIESGSSNETVKIAEFGELNLKGKRTLKGFTLSGFWPAQYYSFCQYSMFYPVDQFKSYIEMIMNSKQPARLLIISEGLNLNMAVLIDEFNFGHKEGSLDLYFELSLREYRFTNLPEPSADRTTWMPHIKDSMRNSGQKYRVKDGDTLMSIAKKELGNSGKWIAIRQKNRIANPLKLRVGQVLTL